ncbi:hypothetical protein [Desulfitobacterium sp.]|uniref:WD40/YVTN/BNR-like repeat-containing protein n=1 Tax=Desulfitobacterium sp. TaxID=49981 RepID=UPI002C0FC3CA|nr:hypothetical protein [Desulfitobacterium sp.]HVJ48498.1 hypothetical protein [Desulfitobacterium sp.]
MYIRKTFILITACLIVLLSSGCNYSTKGADPSNKSIKNFPIFLSAEITDAKFSFLDDKIVWIGLNAINNGSPFTEILSSSDHGQTWSTTLMGNYNIVSMQFVDSEHGWAIGNADPQSSKKVYSILSTKDGGQNWSKQFETVQASRISPYQIQFLNIKDGFARFNTNLFSTTDGGESWRQISSIENLMSFDFRDDKEGWATNTDSIWHTTDGGNIWNKEWSVPENIKKRLEPINSKVIINSTLEGWALFSSEGTMSQTSKIILHRDQSGNWTIESGYYMAAPPFSGNPAPLETSDLFPISDTRAFLVAYTPATYPVAVLKTNDQGKTWLAIIDQSRPKGFPVMLPGDLARINFVNDQLGWAIVVNRSASKNTLNIVKTEDGGANWKVVMQK